MGCELPETLAALLGTLQGMPRRPVAARQPFLMLQHVQPQSMQAPSGRPNSAPCHLLGVCTIHQAAPQRTHVAQKQDTDPPGLGAAPGGWRR